VRDLDNGSKYGLEWLKKRKIVAFCGIGKPANFMDMLESLGASLEKTIAFPDHHSYTRDDIELIEKERASSGVEAIVTTEKDAARLGTDQPVRGLYTLNIKLEIEDNLHFASRINRQN
jgi:tetraacyldisaccharide 4'-kinase